MASISANCYSRQRGKLFFNNSEETLGCLGFLAFGLPYFIAERLQDAKKNNPIVRVNISLTANSRPNFLRTADLFPLILLPTIRLHHHLPRGQLAVGNFVLMRIKHPHSLHWRVGLKSRSQSRHILNRSEGLIFSWSLILFQ